MELWTALISLCWLLLYLRGQLQLTLTLAFCAAWSVLLMLSLTALWIQLQLLPLPAALLQWLSPGAAAIHAASFGASTLSLELFATRVDLGLTLTYLQLFALVLLIINSRERVRVLMITLVICGVFQASYGTFMALSGLEFDYLLVKDVIKHQATGTFINRNHLAGYLEMTLALGVGLLVANMADQPTPQHSWRDTSTAMHKYHPPSRRAQSPLAALHNLEIRRVFLRLRALPGATGHHRYRTRTYASLY